MHSIENWINFASSEGKEMGSGWAGKLGQGKFFCWFKVEETTAYLDGNELRATFEVNWPKEHHMSFLPQIPRYTSQF